MAIKNSQIHYLFTYK